MATEGRSAGDGPRDEAARLKAEADRLDEQARRLREEAKWWDVGGDGEEIVGGVLDAGLSEDAGWHVIHSVVVSGGGGDIDHVVVGMPGAFTLNTKHHQERTVWVSGDVYAVDGRPRPYLSAAIAEAEKATRRLSAACSFNVRVHPVIVVVGSADLQIPQQPRDVRVVGCDDVVGWLQSLPPVLSRHEAAAIAERAGDSATWFPPSTSGRRRTNARNSSRSRPRPGRTKARRRSGLAEVIVALGVVIAAFVLLSRLSHHPVSDPTSSTGATPAASSVPSTTASPTFQAVGTVTNGQCVDAWSDHDVEVLISGAQAGSDCTRFAAPSYTATLAPGGFFTALSGPYGRTTSGAGLEQICSGALSDGDQITVYDDGGSAFGHAFCTSAGVPNVTATTVTPTFQVVGTVTNSECVDAWSDHDVEVQISGAQAGSDCTRFAAPSYTATLAPGGFLTSLSGPYGRSTPGSDLEQICSGALSDGDHITVYDEGGAAFGHAFCTSAGVLQ